MSRPLCRQLTTAGVHEQTCAVGHDLSINGQVARMSVASRPYQGIAQFLSDQYAYLNYPANPTIMNNAPYQSGQVCSTVGVGQPGYGNAFGCVAYSDALTILPNLAPTGTRPGTYAAVMQATNNLDSAFLLQQQQHRWIQEATLANQLKSYPSHCQTASQVCGNLPANVTC